MCTLSYYTSNIRHQHVDDFYGFRFCSHVYNKTFKLSQHKLCYWCRQLRGRVRVHHVPLKTNTLAQHTTLLGDFYGIGVFGSFVCTVFTYLGYLADVFYWARWCVQLKNSSFTTWAARTILPGSEKRAMRLFLMCFKLELLWARWWEATAQ